MKRLQNTLFIIIVILLGCPMAEANFEIIDAPIIKNYVTTNPGLETVTPYMNEVDSNKDGLPESISIGFNVYPIGTANALFQTAIKPFAYPTSPCAKPVWMDTNNTIKFKQISNKMLVLLRTTEISCRQIGQLDNSTSYFGIVYAADLTASGKNVWTKRFAQQIVATDIVPDTNANGYDDLTVVTTDNNGHINVYLFDGNTGTALTTAISYSTH